MLLFGLVVIGFFVLYLVAKFRRQFSSAPTVKPFLYPRLSSLTGPLFDLLSAIKAKSFPELLRRWHDKHGDDFCFSVLGTSPTVVTRRPEVIRAVLNDFSRFSMGEGPLVTGFNLTMGRTILTVGGEEHRRLRRLAAPAFGPQQMDYVCAVAQAKASQVVARWEAMVGAGEREVDVFEGTTAIALDTIGMVAFDHSFKMVDALGSATPGPGSKDGLMEATAFLISAVEKRIQIPMPLWPLLGPSARHVEEARAVVDQQVLSIIQARRDSPGSSSKKDILSALLEAYDSDQLTDAEIASSALVFLFAGFETSANLTALTLLCLASRPELQAAVAREARQVWDASTESGLTVSDLTKLELLDKVIKEAARLYPVASFTARDCLEDCEVEGLRLSKGTMVMIDIAAAHVHPAHWRDPELFDPSRWDEGRPAPTRGSYIPFGEGPKLCIGQNFAKISMKVSISRILANFELVREIRPPGRREIDTSFTMTLSPKDDAIVVMKKRR